MPSTERRLELKEKTSMAQTVWQPGVYAKGFQMFICSAAVLALHNN